jgi:mono/diheme cytochrome c family protein
MSKAKLKFAALLLAMLVGASASLINSQAATPQDLPAGKGVELARGKCLGCHEADLIKQQRLSRAGWVREIEKMVRWGARVSDEEKEALTDYFAAHFSPRLALAAAATNEERGKQIFESKCLNCHEDDLVRQQRLARAAWTREVEKMMRWGANVQDDEKEPLVDYLFKNYGPRPLAVTR